MLWGGVKELFFSNNTPINVFKKTRTYKCGTTKTMILFILIIHIVFIGLLTLPFWLTLYTALFKPNGKILPSIAGSDSNIPTHFACIITAYRRADIALPLVQSLLQQDTDHYTIYIVADQCDDTALFDNLISAHSHKIKLLIPPQALQSKVKSMQYAMAHFVQTHSHIVIFDPDNLAKSDFLAQLNTYIQAGYNAVQGKRIAKNLDTNYACADALGEIYKNYIERYVPFQLGSSASIAGSGMAISSPLFEGFLQCNAIAKLQAAQQVVAAEDKILQNYLVNQQQIIAFAPHALLYDEKVQSGEQVTRQRTRWLFAYFENANNALRHLINGIVRRNWNSLLFGFLSIIPPLFILLLSAILLGCIDIAAVWLTQTNLLAVIKGIAPLKNTFWVIMSLFIWLSILTFALNILLTLYLDKAPKAIWQSLTQLPLFIFRQMKSLLQIKKAKSDFLTTQHNKMINIEDIQQLKH